MRDLNTSLSHFGWIPTGRQVIQSVLQKRLPYVKGNCISAAKWSAFQHQYNRQALLNCAEDYEGPLCVKQGSPRSKIQVKCYVAIFSCLVAKEVHLELVSNFTSDAFIAALRGFIERRGECLNLYSDNGKTFVEPHHQLPELRKPSASQAHQSKLREFAKSVPFTWHFIPLHSPHCGGLWEAGVRCMKYHLKRMVGVTAFPFERVSTLMTQNEVRLNFRL